MKTPKRHFEINWPLGWRKYENTQKEISILKGIYWLCNTIFPFTWLRTNVQYPMDIVHSLQNIHVLVIFCKMLSVVKYYETTQFSFLFTRILYWITNYYFTWTKKVGVHYSLILNCFFEIFTYSWSCFLLLKSIFMQGTTKIVLPYLCILCGRQQHYKNCYNFYSRKWLTSFCSTTTSMS